MVRKLTSITALVVVVFALLPAVAAFAASSTASLSSPANLFAPPAGTQASFGINVSNAEQSTGGVLGIGATPGADINYIRIVMPNTMSNVSCALTGAAADKFNCSDQAFPGGPFELFLTAKNGEALAAGESITVDFDAELAAPFGLKRQDTYTVRTGTDYNDMEDAAGSLVQTVYGLEMGDALNLDDLRTGAEVVQRFTSDITAPGDAGQFFEVSFDLTNRSASDIAVVPSLAGTSFPATLVSDPGTMAPGQQATATFSIDAAGYTAGQLAEQLRASATGTATNVGPNTDASGDAVRADNFQTLTDQRGVIVESEAILEAPANVRDTVLVGNNDLRTNLVPAEEVTIKLNLNKKNFPRVDLAGTNNISFSIPECAACPTVSGDLININEGPLKLPAGNTNAQSLQMTYVVDFAPLAPFATGNLFDLDASLTFNGTDYNQFPFATVISIADLLQIDALAPILLLDQPIGNVQDDVVKDGDSVTISGTVRHTGDLENLSVTISSSQAGVDDNGDPYILNEEVVTEDDLGGDTNPDPNVVEQDFSVTYDLPGDPQSSDELTNALGFAGFNVISIGGFASDDAANMAPGLPRNVGDDLSLDLDNNHADIIPTATFDVAGVQTQLGLAYYISGEPYGLTGDVVRVTWDAGFNLDTVVGGCATNMWSVDGANVDEVLWYDGSTCQEGAKPAPGNGPLGSNINDRLLVLDSDVDPNAGPVNVSFLDDGGDLGFILGTDPVTDDIQNEAYQQDLRLIDGRTPNIPLIDLSLTLRNDTNGSDDSGLGDGTEAVGVSTDTDAAGSDYNLLHDNSGDLQIPVTNFIGGIDDLQIVEITDPVAFASNSLNPPASSYSEIVRIPSSEGDEVFDLVETDIDYDTCGTNCQVRSQRAFRYIRRVSGATEVNGPFLRTDFLFDTQPLLPMGSTLQIGDAGTPDDDLVTVTFDGGSPFTFNDGNTLAAFYGAQDEWTGLRDLGGNFGQNNTAPHLARNVVQNQNTVEVTIDYGVNDANDYVGTQYFKRFPDYFSDLAGNDMDDAYRMAPNGSMEYL